MSKITIADLSRYLESFTIEQILKAIEIEDVEDHVVRTILHTLDHSLSRLREELK